MFGLVQIQSLSFRGKVTCAGKFPLASMGGQAEGLACADPGARTLISASRNFNGSRFSQYILQYILKALAKKSCTVKIWPQLESKSLFLSLKSKLKPNTEVPRLVGSIEDKR